MWKNFCLERTLGLAALLTGCAADDLGVNTYDADQAEPTVAAQVQSRSYQATALRPKLSNPTYSGTLCPAGSGDFNLADGFFSFRAAKAELESSGQSAAGTCRVDFDVTIPPGLNFTKPSMAVGGASLVSAGGRSQVSLRYAVNNGPWVNGTTQSFSDPDFPDYAFTDRPAITSTSCGATQPQRIRVSVEMRANVTGLAYLNILSLESSFLYAHGTEWSACSGYTLVKPPPQQRGQACGESLAPCATNLRCQLSSPAQGQCVDPRATTIRPAAIGQACGTYREIPCARGAVCHYEDPATKAAKLPGTCRAPKGPAKAVCGGVPKLGCNAPFSCIDNVCTNTASGARLPVGADCSTAGRICADGLSCQQDTYLCEYLPGFIGDACDVAQFRRCATGLLCDTASKSCTPRNPGAANSRCRPGVDQCNAGLVCNSIRKVCVPG